MLCTTICRWRSTWQRYRYSPHLIWFFHLLINVKFFLNGHKFNSVEFVKLIANVSRVPVDVRTQWTVARVHCVVRVDVRTQWTGARVHCVWSVLMSELSKQLLVFIVWSNNDVFIVEPRKVARVTRSWARVRLERSRHLQRHTGSILLSFINKVAYMYKKAKWRRKETPN